MSPASGLVKHIHGPQPQLMTLASLKRHLLYTAANQPHPCRPVSSPGPAAAARGEPGAQPRHADVQQVTCRRCECRFCPRPQQDHSVGGDAGVRRAWPQPQHAANLANALARAELRLEPVWRHLAAAVAAAPRPKLDAQAPPQLPPQDNERYGHQKLRLKHF